LAPTLMRACVYKHIHTEYTLYIDLLYAGPHTSTSTPTHGGPRPHAALSVRAVAPRSLPLSLSLTPSQLSHHVLQPHIWCAICPAPPRVTGSPSPSLEGGAVQEEGAGNFGCECADPELSGRIWTMQRGGGLCVRVLRAHYRPDTRPTGWQTSRDNDILSRRATARTSTSCSWPQDEQVPGNGTRSETNK